MEQKKYRAAIFDMDGVIVDSEIVYMDYLLDFAKEGQRKISYAASVGRDSFLPQYRESFAESLKTFHAVSVREKSAWQAVREAAGK